MTDSPGKVVDFLEILQRAQKAGLQVRAGPHQVKIVAIWVHLNIETLARVMSEIKNTL